MIRYTRQRSRFAFPELLAFTFLLGAGCITVNVYFPESELREAAAEIVGEARPEITNSAPADTENGSKEPAPGNGNKENEKKAALWGCQHPRPFLSLFAPRIAYASEQREKEKKGEKKEAKEKKALKLEISTPAIDKIREALKNRYPKLLPFYEKGAIGEGKDGYLYVRETENLSLKEKRDVRLLVDEENSDRKNLYTELARENKIESSRIPDIATLFSEEWQKKCKPGWWIEKEKGKWGKKEEEKKK